MPQPLRVLILEDNPKDAELVVRELRRAGFEPDWRRVDTEKDYLANLNDGFDIILSDYAMPQFDGMRALELLKQRGLDIPFVIVSGKIGEDVAVQAVRNGAADYLLKDRIARLGPAVEHVLEQERLRREKRAAQQALLDSEKLFRTLLESSPLGIMLLDDNGQCTYCNRRGLDIFGTTLGESMGMGWACAIQPSDMESVIKDWLAALREGREFSCVFGLRSPQQHVRWVSARSSPISREASRAIYEKSEMNTQGHVATIGDITAERALADSEVSYRRLFEAAKDGILILEADTGRISDVNPFLLEMLGFSHGEVVGKSIWEISPFKDIVSNKAKFEQLQQQGYARYENLPLKTKDGRHIAVEFVSNVYSVRGGKVIQCNIRDITERRRFEQTLQQTNAELESAKLAAEKASLAKSDFLSSMSHELRSPLNAILGFAQLMGSDSPSPTASQTKSIAQILEAGWYLLKLINETLDLAGIESGQAALSKESVAVAEIMSECQAMTEPQAQQRGIRMTFPRFDNPIFVCADRTRLKQIVINLLSNAIKYNREQGTVVVDCTVSAPERIRISVKDTGAGLSPEMLAQLFTPFNRLGQEAGSVAGTGIGLVVSKRLAELMEGVLGVESTVGVGSVFWCDLNSAAAPQLKDQSGEAEALVRPPVPVDVPLRTLLYVEDNPANMELVEQLIARRQDLRLVTAVNGTLGIELARATQPQVILLDINLPGISGFQALKILREDPVTAHIPVVALSANAMPRDIAKGLQAGFFSYLTKPIQINEFMDVLDTALEHAEKDRSPDPFQTAKSPSRPSERRARVDRRQGPRGRRMPQHR